MPKPSGPGELAAGNASGSVPLGFLSTINAKDPLLLTAKDPL
jgi:hypothetical protein